MTHAGPDVPIPEGTRAMGNRQYTQSMSAGRVPVLTLHGLIWIHAGLALFVALMAMWVDHLPD
ncbi:hypothetical protein SXCC_01225 [Gluconacetobacter sp. SXCC-1]|nr:hypothetical protein SXCC_01225 [Gluconacetobacter sp. SXCC-1]